MYMMRYVNSDGTNESIDFRNKLENAIRRMEVVAERSLDWNITGGSLISYRKDDIFTYIITKVKLPTD